jgi:hypothetical protein
MAIAETVGKANCQDTRPTHAQEPHSARRAGEGSTNPEIGPQLFLGGPSNDTSARSSSSSSSRRAGELRAALPHATRAAIGSQPTGRACDASSLFRSRISRQRHPATPGRRTNVSTGALASHRRDGIRTESRDATDIANSGCKCEPKSSGPNHRPRDRPAAFGLARSHLIPSSAGLVKASD